MKKQLLSLLLILTALVVLTFCRKKEELTPKPDELPPITTSGKNTFGCLVNGCVWLPQVHINFGGLRRLTASMNAGGVSIQATKRIVDENIYQGIGIAVHNNWLDSMALDYPNDSSIFEREGASAGFYNFPTGCELTTDTINKGYIKFLRIDHTERIVSGIFEFTVAQPGYDTIRITNGRFDIKL
jgi:hypothetical protein